MTEDKQEATQEMSEQKGLNIVQKLVMASKMIKPVAKDGENSFNNYRFQSEAAIKAAVKPALEATGLMIIPSYEMLNQEDRQGRKGSNHYVDVLGRYDITDGHETLHGSMLGSGQDTAEKAMMKAATAAQKNFYKQLFNISDQETDGDADESPSSTDKKNDPVASAQEIATFKQLLADFAAKDGSQPNDIYKSIAGSAGVTTKFNELSEAELGKLKIALSKITG